MALLIDTNVISEMMRQPPERAVQRWLDLQIETSTWITSVNILEVRAGILLLPVGKRRQLLGEAFDLFLSETIAGRILPFDLAAAESSAIFTSERIRRGFNKETRDTQIAGIVASRRATLATRNVRDFEDLDIRIVNPWEE